MSEDLRFRVFLVALPEFVPLPHGTIISTRLDKFDPRLEGITFQADQEKEFTFDSDGNIRVSIKFWQPMAKFNKNEQIYKALMRVISAIRGPHSMSASESQDFPEPETCVTIAEMVTTHFPDDDDDILERCFTVLTDACRSLRLAQNTPSPEVTRARIFPFAVTMLRSGDGRVIEPWEQVWLENIDKMFQGPPVSISNETWFRANVHHHRLRQGDPWLASEEHLLESQYALFSTGDYASSVLRSAMACESALLTTATMLMWEEKQSEEEAAARLAARELAPLMSGILAGYLGGKWDAAGNPAVAEWRAKVAKPRNMVVHASHRPSGDAAHDALVAAIGLRAFVLDRLIDKRNKFPRTTLLAVGEAGLKRRGVWSNRMAHFVASEGNAADGWIGDYVSWRRRVETRLF